MNREKSRVERRTRSLPERRSVRGWRIRRGEGKCEERERIFDCRSSEPLWGRRKPWRENWRKSLFFSGKWKGEGKRIEVFRVGGIWIFMLRGGRKESSTDTERDPVQISEHWIHFFSHFICDFCSGFAGVSANNETRGHITRSFLFSSSLAQVLKGRTPLQKGSLLNRWN